MAFFLVYCARPEDWIPGVGHLHVAMITGVSAFVAFLTGMGRSSLRLPTEVLCLVALLAQMAIASVLSPVWKGGAISQTVQFGKLVLIVVIITLVVTSLGRARKLMFVQTGCAIMVAVASLRYGAVVSGRLNGAVAGMYGSCNDLAMASVMSIPLCLVFLYQARAWWRRALWTASLAIMLYATLRTGSRSGFVALVVAATVLLWNFAVRGRRPQLILAGLLCGLALLFAGGRQVIRRFSETFSSSGDYEYAAASATARQELLVRSLEVTADHPLFGVGPGNFQVVSGLWQPSHNVYTALSSEAGIPALLLFIAIYWGAFANLRRIRKGTRKNSEIWMFACALQASLWAFAFGGMFFPDAYQYFVYFTFALTTCLSRVGFEVPPSKASARAAGYMFAYEQMALPKVADTGMQVGRATHSRPQEGGEIGKPH